MSVISLRLGFRRNFLSVLHPNLVSSPIDRVVKPKIEMLTNHPIEFSMIVYTKWEILVQKLLKSVELFKSYGLFGEPKVVDFLGFFGKMLKK